MSCYNAIILANQVSGLFDQRYLKKKYTCTIFMFFPKQIYMETKKQTENLLMLNSIIPKASKKRPRNGNSQDFKIRLYWLLISFDF